MSVASLPGPKTHRARRQFIELLKVEALLALREPFAIGAGLALPIVLLGVFGRIGQQNPGLVADSGQTIIDLGSCLRG